MQSSATTAELFIWSIFALKREKKGDRMRAVQLICMCCCCPLNRAEAPMSADSTTFRLHHYLICAFDKIMSLWDLQTTGQLESSWSWICSQREKVKTQTLGWFYGRKSWNPKWNYFNRYTSFDNNNRVSDIYWWETAMVMITQQWWW